MIHVFAIHETRPGQRDTVLRALQPFLPIVRAEDGCLAYDPATDVPGGPPMLAKLGPDGFAIVERWASRAALEAHAAADRMAQFREQVANLIASRSFYVVEQLAA